MHLVAHHAHQLGYEFSGDVFYHKGALAVQMFHVIQVTEAHLLGLKTVHPRHIQAGKSIMAVKHEGKITKQSE